MGEKNGIEAGSVEHPTLGKLHLGNEVARVRLEPGDRKSAATVLRKFGPALAAESMMFIMEHINSPDEKYMGKAVDLMKSMMPYVASKAPTVSVNKTDDGGEIKTSVKEALMEALGERFTEAEYEVDGE